MENGLNDCEFEPDGIPGEHGAASSKGRKWRSLPARWPPWKNRSIALERRGISLRAHAVRQDPVTRKLPIYHVFLGSEEHWFTRREELDNFVAQHEEETGQEVSVGATPGGPTAQTAPPAVPPDH